jgi:predicted phage terminase large subunit-like protein
MDILRRTVIDNPFVPKELNGHPFPTLPQAYFLTLPVKEALYGGAAGGGKSAALLAAALQYVAVPGYSAILFRRTLTDLELEGSLIPMSHQWLADTAADWDGQEHKWRFPSGAVLSFGYMKDQYDHMRYKSAAFQTVCFDELTTFTETQYRFLFGRIRKPDGMPVPLRCLSASNPGDVGHDWVLTRFQPDRPEGDRHTPGRVFVPARLEENPGLDREAYEAMLSELDEVTRQQMRAGDWKVRPGGSLFKREWFNGQILDAVPPCVRKVRYWDLAATEPAPGKDPDYTAGILMGADGAGGYVVLDCQEFRATPYNRNKVIRQKAEEDGRDVEVWVEQEPGSAGLNTIDQMARDVLPGYGVYPMRHTGDKLTRAKPFSAACERGLVKLVRGTWLGSFLDRLCGFGLPGVHDDVPDAAAGAHEALAVRGGAWDEAAARRAFDGPARPIGEAGEVSRHLPRLLREAGEWGGGD